MQNRVLGEITSLIIGLLLIKDVQVNLGDMSSTTRSLLGRWFTLVQFEDRFRGLADTAGPVLGTYGIFPLWRQTVRMDQVKTASPMPVHEGTYQYSHVVYLSGEFGLAKIFFEAKGGRDHLLAILKTRFPKVAPYRRT